MGYYHWRYGYEVRKIQKVGNSFMVAIPPAYLERLKLKKGDEVSIEKLGEAEWEGLVIKLLKKEKKDNEADPV